MRRYVRRYDIVPVVEGFVEDDLCSEPVLERVKQLSFGFIRYVDNLRKYLQPLFGLGVCSPAASVGEGVERRSAPGAGYLGEETVLDGVELGAVGRVVHDEYLQADAVGEVHEILLEDAVPAGAGAAPVAEDDEHPCVGVELLQVAVPDTADVPVHELGGVVAGAYRRVARVVRQVAYAVRNDHAFGEGPEVVVEGLWGGRAVYLSVTLEVAERLLLLGVHADDGYPRLDAGCLRRAYLGELGVPILHLAQRQALGERPPLEPRRFEHLSADGRRNMVEKFSDPLADSVRGASEGLAHRSYRAALGACRLACNKKHSLAFVKRAKVLLFRLANLYWRFLLYQCNVLKINYKDTKNLQLFYIKMLIINGIYRFFSNPVAITTTSLHLVFNRYIGTNDHQQG